MVTVPVKKIEKSTGWHGRVKAGCSHFPAEARNLWAMVFFQNVVRVLREAGEHSR